MKLDLEELRRLHEAATPGPWHWEKMRNGIDYGYLGPNGETTPLFGEAHEGAVDEDNPDGKMLCATRNALPALLARAEVYEAAVAVTESWKTGRVAAQEAAYEALRAAVAKVEEADKP